MSSGQSWLNHWDDTIKAGVQIKNPAINYLSATIQETVSVPARRLSSSSPTLKCIPEEDEEFEEIPLEPEHPHVAPADPITNVELTYGNSLLHQTIWEETCEKDEASYYEEDKYHICAHPIGYPNNRTYGNFSTQFTKRKLEKLDEWILSISSGSSESVWIQYELCGLNNDFLFLFLFFFFWVFWFLTKKNNKYCYSM